MARLWQSRETASFMLMPEAAMHEDRDPVLGQDNIRRSGQIATVKPKAIAHRMKKLPNTHLGPGISPAN